MPGSIDLSTKQHVLISFQALYDLDVGLIEVIRERYASKKAFDFDKLYQSNRDMLISLYERKDMNPLTVIANNDISKEDLDEYYKQFTDQEIDNIYDKSIYTDLIKLIAVIKSDKTLEVDIVYYNNKEKEYLSKDETLSNIRKVFVNDIYKNKKTSYKYDFVYVKSLYELLNLYILESSLIYVAGYGYNLNEDKSDFDNDNPALKVFFALDRNNQLGIYEPYNQSNWNNNQEEDNTYDDIPIEEDEEEYDDINEGEDI